MLDYTDSPVDQRASDVRGYSLIAMVGMLALVSGNSAIAENLINDGGADAQVDTLTVSGATAAKEYTVTINGIAVSFTAGGAPTTTTIATGLAAAINAEPLVRGSVSATSAVAVVTVTALLDGATFTITEADAQLSTASVTSPSEASELAYGRACKAGAYVVNANARSGALATGYTAQVDTLDYTYSAGETLTARVKFRGQWYEGSATMATNKATSSGLVAAELNAVLPADSILAAAGAGDALILTAEIAGESFESSILATDSATTLPSVASTRSQTTSLVDSFGGISSRTLDEQSETLGANPGTFKAGATFPVASERGIWVLAPTTDPAIGGDVFVETTAGANAGKLQAAAADCTAPVLLAGASWLRTDSASGVALVKIA